MDLKLLVRQKIINDVLRAVKREGQWKVLVVDTLSIRIISSCIKIHEIAAEGIAIIEDISKKREPLTTMEAIYLISPTDKSIQLLQQDFMSSPKALYKGAHVFFTDKSEFCPKELFNELYKNPYIKTLKDINISFLPYESRVYSLECRQSFHFYYNSSKESESTATLERMAEQLVTLCVTLGEYPNVRYRSDFERNAELAQLIQQKLDAYKAVEPTLGEKPEKDSSQLIIVDRGLDCVSPLLHELTLQAMAYDLLPIKNDVFKFKTSNHEKKVILDQNDEFWEEWRHKHIAIVSQNITKQLKELVDNKPMKTNDRMSLKDLCQMIKVMPQYMKELNKYSTHLHLAEDCMKSYQGYVDKLCKVEQDLAMKRNAEGKKIKDPMINIVPILEDQNIDDFDKIRIILLYIQSKNGISEKKLARLIQHSQIPPSDNTIITNMSHLGVNIISDRGRKKVYRVPRKERITENMYKTWRWTPIIKKVMKDSIEDKLNVKHFPFLARRVAQSGYGIPKSINVLYRHWYKNKNDLNIKKVRRLILFIVGGISYSEMRCVYELTNASNNWEIIIGSDHIITPEDFLQNLKQLNC